MTAALDDRPTVPLVRQEVRNVLENTPAFRELSSDDRRDVANAMVNIGQFIADAGGETYGVPMGAAITDDVARALEDENPDSVGDSFGQNVDDFTRMIDNVDFPQFVSGLIQGVFQAIVDSSIQQMEAFAELVKNVAKTAQEYMADNISENQARDHLVERYPDHLQIDLSDENPRVVPKPEADESNMPDFMKDLGLDFPFDDLDEETTESVLMPAAREQMAIDRQRMLLMLVMMGINRLVVTDGSIKAAVIFELDAESSRSDSSERATEYDRTTTRKKKSGVFSGWFSPKWRETTKTSFNVTTSNTNESEDSAELKAKLTGDVTVRFKSETFPLQDMSNLLGVQEPSLPATAPRSQNQDAGVGS